MSNLNLQPDQHVMAFSAETVYVAHPTSDGELLGSDLEGPAEKQSGTTAEQPDFTPEYATGLKLIIIVSTICFSTLLTALDLVST